MYNLTVRSLVYCYIYMVGEITQSDGTTVSPLLVLLFVGHKYSFVIIIIINKSLFFIYE